MVHGPYQTSKLACESHPNASIIRPVFNHRTERTEYLAFDNSYDALWHPTTSGTEFLRRLIYKRSKAHLYPL